jgi:hypothetical protein
MNDKIKQKRDAKGRFLTVPGTKRYTIKDIERAYLAGLAAQSYLTFQAPSQKVAKYIRENNIT